MGKISTDTILDQPLDYVSNNADKLVLCDGEPADYSAATTDKSNGGNALGETSISSADFTKADGDTSGRKTTVSSQSGVSVDDDGTADHYAIIDDNNSDLLHVTTISNSQSVSSGNEFDSTAFDIEYEDPS